LAELAIFIVRPNAKLVLHWHSDVDSERFGVLAKLHAPLTRWIIQRASKIIGATKAHIDFSDYREMMIGKSSIIPYPFRRPDASILSESKKLVRNKFEERFVVLAVGRLIYYKGFQYLIEAAKYLPPKCLVMIVGSGPLAGKLQTHIDSNGLSDRVMLMGGLNESELMNCFSLCDLFCLPSTDRGEMFGMVQLEAMAFKKPVVGTRIPHSGVCEVNLHNITGLTVSVRDSAAIANAIYILMNDPNYRYTLGQRGYKRVEEVFDMSVVIPQFVNLFSECLTG
jgi:rhamnosyl/mannosyltransferase